MSKKLNLNLNVGEVDFFQCYKLNTRRKAIEAIKAYNRYHKTEITHKVMGGGIELRRKA